MNIDKLIIKPKKKALGRAGLFESSRRWNSLYTVHRQDVKIQAYCLSSSQHRLPVVRVSISDPRIHNHKDITPHADSTLIQGNVMSDNVR